MKKILFGTFFFIVVTSLLWNSVKSSLAGASQKSEGSSLKLILADSYQEPVKGNLITKMIGPAEFGSDELVASLKAMCKRIENLDKHSIQIFTDRRFYQDDKFVELLRNAPVLNDKTKAGDKNFRLLQDNFIASYNPYDGSLDIYPFKTSASGYKRINMGNNWCKRLLKRMEGEP